MMFFKCGLCLVILQVLPLSVCAINDVELLVNRVLPWFEEESFAESFYLNSRISLLSLTSPLQANTNDTILRSPTLDGLTTITNDVSDRSKSSCAIHLQYILTKLWTNQRDASLLSFIDSFAKPVPGIRNGNLNWHGNQMQCESSIISLKFDSEYPSKFGGKYCKAEWGTKFGSGHVLKHFTGVCLPDSCSGKDFEYMKSFLEKFFFLKISDRSHVEEIGCTPESKMGVDSIIFYSICISFIFLGILSTIYDQNHEKSIKNVDKNSNEVKPSILSIFSIPRNWRSLDGRRVSKNDILIVHYIRGVAAFIVAFFHVGGGLASSLAADPGFFAQSIDQAGIFWLVPRTFMTIFFFISGFLIHPDYSNPNRNFNPFISIIKAFLRLSPSYYFTLLAQTALISKIGLGSKIDLGGFYHDRSICSATHVENLVYFNNLFTATDMCNPVFWSLAVTFQAYVICVFIVWLLLRPPFIGKTSALLVIIYGSVMSFKALQDAELENLIKIKIGTMNLDLMLEFMRDVIKFLDVSYFKTISWLCPVTMGIIFAYFLPKIQQAQHSTKKQYVRNSCVLIAVFYLIIAFLGTREQSQLIFSSLQAAAPIGPGLILSLIIFLFHPRSHFLENQLTSETYPSLVHLSRISYPLYLIHYPILLIVLNISSFPPVLNIFTSLCIFGGTLFVIYIVSVFLYIFIERPIQSIRKIFLIG
ncbi:uncharacterized protein LOC141849928 [Brevipalpus obovatus]|uniref:uncharacterized protein LOC141849928 n=1 Tax=Brevipalpus obovatus TaxID=246614 RepID=UPI003D9EB4A3